MPEEDRVEIKKTGDLDAVRDLCVRAGLEMEDSPLDGIVVAYGAFVDGRLVGCATLQSTDGGLFLEYVAVDPSVRKKGVGARLVSRIEEEAKARGLSELWAKARSPGFYERIGFRILGENERGPKNLDSCQGCPQFRVSCSPAIVVKKLL